MGLTKEEDARVRDALIGRGFRDGWQVLYHYRELPKECMVRVSRIDDSYKAAYAELRVGSWTWDDLVSVTDTTPEGALRMLKTGGPKGFSMTDSHFDITPEQRIAFVKRALKAWKQHGE